MGQCWSIGPQCENNKETKQDCETQPDSETGTYTEVEHSTVSHVLGPSGNQWESTCSHLSPFKSEINPYDIQTGSNRFLDINAQILRQTETYTKTDRDRYQVIQRLSQRQWAADNGSIKPADDQMTAATVYHVLLFQLTLNLMSFMNAKSVFC